MAPALLTAVEATGHVHLIVGSNPLAGARCTRSLEVGARPVVVAAEDGVVHYSLLKRVEAGEAEWLRRGFRDEDLTLLGREEVGGVVDAVFVTEGGKLPLATHIASLCRRLRIPVNVSDAPGLCSFTLLSTYSDGPLQIGVTTSGRGCKLAARIRRELAASLPVNLGVAVDRLGALRKRIWEEDQAAAGQWLEPEVEDEDSGQSAGFNQLVTPEDGETARNRRMRWLAQICEYWPLRRLAEITDADVDSLLRSYRSSRSESSFGSSAADASGGIGNGNGNGIGNAAAERNRKGGRIILAGSGPGHPDLLTRATHKAILAADVILADKLVPSAVLDLVPRRVPVHIARKFPGNADKAQEELLEMGLDGLRAGKVVVRLKQGDPYVYGRGGEEYNFFRDHGYIPVVLPGITSALSAPLFADIPCTHRNVADQILVCTGTGRKGAVPDPPPYLASRTVIFLMALHRLPSLIDSLLSTEKGYPQDTPCAVLERASCSDQRIIRTTLAHVCAAVDEEGSRPPGLLVVGHACSVLAQCHSKWVVEDGFRGFDGVDIERVDHSLLY